METGKTYFEQIPVASVKKIADVLPAYEIGDRKPVVDISTREDWREIAKRVQAETDPDKMIELVQDLLQKLDEEKIQNGPSIPEPQLSTGAASLRDEAPQG